MKVSVRLFERVFLPWGLPTKGKKTRSNKRTDTFIVSSRHNRKK